MLDDSHLIVHVLDTIGHEFVDWWALTINNEAGLEIISVELFTP